MARCKSCGVELRTGARFCDMCGAKVEKICPNCGEVLRAQAKFCDLCGEKLPLAQLISRPKVHGDICAGRLHTVALKEDGTLLATGDNQFGQCDVRIGRMLLLWRLENIILWQCALTELHWQQETVRMANVT